MRTELRTLSAPPCDNDDNIVRVSNIMNVKLSNHLLRAQSSNDLYDVELEIPSEDVFLYDENKNVFDVITVTMDESLGAAQDMITYLHETGSVGDNETTPFEVADGKLIRTYID